MTVNFCSREGVC